MAEIQPIHVALYIESLQGQYSKPTIKQHLACLRMMFDWLVCNGSRSFPPKFSDYSPVNESRCRRPTGPKIGNALRAVVAFDAQGLRSWTSPKK